MGNTSLATVPTIMHSEQGTGAATVTFPEPVANVYIENLSAVGGADLTVTIAGAYLVVSGDPLVLTPGRSLSLRLRAATVTLAGVGAVWHVIGTV